MKWPTLPPHLTRPQEIFRFANIPVSMDFSGLIILVIYAGTIATVYLPSLSPNHNQLTYGGLGLLTALLFFATILGHELAHALVARWQGVGIKGIVLYIFGGVAQLTHEPKQPQAEFLIAGAGPLASLIFALLSYLLAFVLPIDLLAKMFLHLGSVNMILVGFNLLPGFPMDGGRMLHALVWHYRKDYEVATKTSLKGGSIIAISLMGVGLATLFLHPRDLTGVWTMLTGLLLIQLVTNASPELLRAAKEHRQTQSNAGSQKALLVKDLMQTKWISTRLEMPLSELLQLPLGSQTAIPVLQGQRLFGMVIWTDIKKLATMQPTKLVRDVMQPVDRGHFVTSDLSVADATNALHRNGLGQAAVLDNQGMVVGFLTLQDLAHTR